MQTPFWVKLKEKSGWKTHQMEDIWILQKSLPLGKNFLYSPEVDFEAIKNIENYLLNIKKNIKNEQTLFYRLEILTENDDKIVDILKKNGFIKSFEEVQPEYRQIINLDQKEEEILAQMKPKGRYNIKVAKKNGVEVKVSKNLDEFYKLLKETSKRDKFSIRAVNYFQNLINAIPDEHISILTAYYKKKPVSSTIIIFYGQKVTYLYGASSDEYRFVMAPYLLHFQIMLLAKEKGCLEYDLGAVAPEGVEKHKYAGISRFKRQFGGKTIHLVGSWDFIYRPFWYKLFKIAESFRRK